MTAITTLGLLTRNPMSSVERGKKLFATVQSVASDLGPRRYDVSEPIQRVFNADRVDDALLLWGGPRFFWETRLRGGLGSYFEGTSRNTMDTLHISIERDDFDASGMLELLKSLTVEFGAVFSYVHTSFDEDLEDRERYRTQIMPFCQGLSAADFERELPGVAWAMCFGNEYVERIGRERLLAVPAYSVCPLANDGLFVQTTQRLRKFNPDAERFRQVSRVLMQYLGGRPG